MKTSIPAVLLLMTTACSSTGGTATPAPGAGALAYTTPSGSPLTYEVADTAQIVMDMMGQSIQVDVRSAAMIGLELTRSASGLVGTLTFQSVAGDISNSMAPGVTISDADKPGPIELTVDPNGKVAVTSAPELSTVMRQVFGSESWVQRLFVPVPGRPVQAGTSWTDTVSVNDEAAGMATQTKSVVTSTLRGDTTVAGRSLLVIDSKATSTQQVAGEQQGVEIRQTVTGTSTAVTLWDPARGVVVERIETSTGAGSMELPAMGMSGIPVNIRQIQIMRLRT